MVHDTSAGALSEGLVKGDTLGPHDIVGTSFFVAQNCMIAFTIFFYMERGSVPAKWRTSVTVAAMVTGIAAWNYGFMKEAWVKTQTSPTVYRYTDWLITVPLLMLEFFCVLRACTRCDENVFWRLLIGSLVMLMGGYVGEVGLIACLPGFCIGMCGWAYIINEIFNGECAQLNAKCNNKAAMKAFNTLRMLVLVGWAIYPLGYVSIVLLRGAASVEAVNVLYNIADMWNKGFFGLAVWAAAREDMNN